VIGVLVEMVLRRIYQRPNVSVAGDVWVDLMVEDLVF